MFAYIIVVGMSVAITAAIDAPPSFCFGMMPILPAPPQTSPPPYSITVAANVVKPGSQVDVVITSSYPGLTMNSIILQGRQGDKIVGKWTINKDDKVSQLLDCGEPDNTVTHKGHHPDLDKRTVTYSWTAPVGIDGEVRFRATIIQSYSIFWVGIESVPVKIIK